MTSAPQTLIDLQNKLVNNLHTVNLGIVGDDAHVATGGYHIGAASLRRNGMSNDYSLEFPADRNVTHDFACAIDIGGDPNTLNLLGTRLVHALQRRDGRVYGKVRAVNAPFDGVSIDRRYDCENPSTPLDDNLQSSSDRNHIHIEIYRSLVTNQSVVDGLYDVLSGGGTSAPSPTPPPKPGAKIHQGAPVPSLIRQGSGQYLGLITGPSASHGGYYAAERPIIKMLQQRLIACGFVPGISNVNSSWADGKFEQPTADAVTRFQRAHMPHTQYYGQVWWDDWTKLFNL